jgi:hypothetical protein
MATKTDAEQCLRCLNLEKGRQVFSVRESNKPFAQHTTHLQKSNRGVGDSDSAFFLLGSIQRLGCWIKFYLSLSLAFRLVLIERVHPCFQSRVKHYSDCFESCFNLGFLKVS